MHFPANYETPMKSEIVNLFKSMSRVGVLGELTSIDHT